MDLLSHKAAESTAATLRAYISICSVSVLNLGAIVSLKVLVRTLSEHDHANLS